MITRGMRFVQSGKPKMVEPGRQNSDYGYAQNYTNENKQKGVHKIHQMQM